MNTLHMYHWHDEKKLLTNLGLLTQGDSLVIYGTLSDDDLLSLNHHLTGLKNTWYIVNHHKRPHISHQFINESQWLELIIKHKNTLSWK